MLQTGMIVGGWDKYEGGKIYGIPLGGTVIEQPFAIGGMFVLHDPSLLIDIQFQSSSASCVHLPCLLLVLFYAFTEFIYEYYWSWPCGHYNYEYIYLLLVGSFSSSRSDVSAWIVRS